MFVNRYLAGALVALLVLSTGGKALAAPITGTLDFIVFDPSMDDDTVGASLLFSASDTETFAASGDFAPPPPDVPNGTSFGPFTLDTTSLGSFFLSSIAHGSFDASSGVVTRPDDNHLVVTLFGIFAGLPGFDPTSAIVALSFSQEGGEGTALEATLRLTALGVAPPPVPEPGVWSLLAIGGLALAWRRRANAR